MTIIVRIDVRKTEQQARIVEATQKTKGFAVTVEKSVLAIWNWADGDEGSDADDAVASDADSEVWVVISRG